MSHTSAHLHIGRGHPNDGGLVQSERTFELVEGRFVGWMFRSRGGRTIWASAGFDQLLRDGVLMALAYGGVKHELRDQICRVVSGDKYLSESPNYRRLQLDQLPDVDNALQKIFEDLKRLPHSEIKSIFNIYKGSFLLKSIREALDLKMNVEICTTKYIKEYSMWSDGVTSEGSL